MRAYTYVDDLVEGVYMLMQSDLDGPTIVGGDEYVTVDELVETVIDASGKEIQINHVEGPVGVASLRARPQLRQIQDQVIGLGGEDESSRRHRQDVSMD